MHDHQQSPESRRWCGDKSKLVAENSGRAGSAPLTNPGFPAHDRIDNCVNCAIATDAIFAGRPALALPQLYYIEPDALGAPRVVIDPDRDVAVWRWDLTDEAFGASAPNQDPDADGVAFVLDLRLPGQRYDAASELNENYFRDYDPTTGRYVQSDPIGLGGGLSTYGYANANASPMAYSDPEGLAAGYLARRAARKFFPVVGTRAAANTAARLAQRQLRRAEFQRKPAESAAYRR
ncbi:MAG: RHS repeat-associated core domain-containing protein [Lysobacteraceae bacterium]|nr:MAG: RHS repeat-associated core domain-containing protein [Xanthomonadaceae bacterium]